jgi:UDP-N-acetylmuramoyl-L-alanyl-D-glutamate--2,6-diaminopimelate ligase
MENAGKGDVLLIAGKGHETYQEINRVYHHFDDREIIREIIEELEKPNVH